MSYKVSGQWSTTETQPVDGHVIALQVTDLRETRTGRVFVGGAQRVTVDGKAVRGGTFKGETAWMDAERLYGDLRWAIGRERFDFAARKIVR